MTTNAKIATLTLNPAIDQTAHVANFAIDEVNRVADDQSDAGGKGVNVASFLAGFGHKIAAAGILGTQNTDLFETLCAEKSIENHFTMVPGATRVNVKIVDEVKNTVTDVNFPGLTPRAENIEAVFATIETLSKDGAETFVLAGSLPAGVPKEIYADLTRALIAKGKRVVLDTSGEALGHAIKCGPSIIKPNIAELSELIGKDLHSQEEIVSAARALNPDIELVTISMGEKGAIFITQNEALLAIPPKAVVKSTVGAGDAMVAGIIHGIYAGQELAEIARTATGFSLGALGEIGPCLPDAKAIEAFAEQVTIETLKL